MVKEVELSRDKVKRRIGNSGFSLVELIVVITIMGVLVGLLAPQFIRFVEKGRKGIDTKNGQEIGAAIEAAIADGSATGTIPRTKVDDTANTIGTILKANNYLAEFPNPKSGEANACYYAQYNSTSGEVKVFFSTNGTTDSDKIFEVYPDNEY